MNIKSVFVFLVLTLLFFGCSNNDPDPADDNEDPIQEIPIDLIQFSREHKGFNLLGKFDVNWSNSGFSEEEFIIIKDLGFNFVRLPLDYRTYTRADDWNVFLENELAEIDQVIEWGKQYGVHVCINLHRAPGYCVNTSALPANQDLDLWSDPVAQDAFVNHWSNFARRYRDESYEDVSFNLVNEPDEVEEASYVQIMEKAIDKIHEINPNRIVFVDGLNYARNLITSLRNKKNIIQAIHVYDPFTLTHYKAGWVNGSDTWPVPVWPITNISNYLYGPWKNEFQSSLEFEGVFSPNTEIIINVHQVSIESSLQIQLDDVEIYRKDFTCGPDPGEDWTIINETQWGYQNISDKDYSVVLPSGGNVIRISNIEGDWLTINSIRIRNNDYDLELIPGNTSWGAMQKSYKITAEGELTETDGSPAVALTDLMEKFELAEAEKIPVMIQEFGVYNQTPHEVTLAYLSDVVDIFKTYQVGYTLWNLSGSFGILNSSRDDCSYTSYQGKQLDQAMTQILQ